MPSPHQLHVPTENPDYRFHPTQLSGKARADHVEEAILDYHQDLIQNNPAGATLKFERLKKSAHIFMRGTADLMYRDFAGTDADKAVVLCVGDVHLENYGVMEANDGTLLWGLNDFDEAYFAPFTWDVKRGATSIVLAAAENGLSKKKTEKLARAFAHSYLETITESMAKEELPSTFTEANSPEEIKELLKETARKDEGKWLAQKYLDLQANQPRFRETEELERIVVSEDALRAEIQTSLDQYRKSLVAQNEKIPHKLKVWDLATKKGSGTASIGLWRCYALVEATDEDNAQLLILEIKQDRKSVLEPYLGEGLLLFPSEGSRVAYAEDIHLPHANPYYGYTQIRGHSFLVRKRSAYKNRLKISQLEKYKPFKKYVKACGQALALAHLQSDGLLMKVYPNFAEAILHSVSPDSFDTDISGFAVKMAAQVKRDWKYFQSAAQAGRFSFGAHPPSA
jgi:uncharacterized protein (DUF2252 family)